MSSENIIKFCPNCGNKTIPHAKFCIECGYELALLYKEKKEDKYDDNGEIRKTPKTNLEEKFPQDSDIYPAENISDTDKTIDSPKTFDIIRPTNNNVKYKPQKHIKKDFKLLNQILDEK